MQPSSGTQRIVRMLRELQAAQGALHAAQRDLLRAIEHDSPTVDAERLIVAGQSRIVMAILADLQALLATSHAGTRQDIS